MLTALSRKNSGVNGVELGKSAALTPLYRKKGALTVLSRKNGGVNGVEPGKKRI